MHFMHIDETGKSVLNEPTTKFLLVGGVVLKQENVQPALEAFKRIYGKHRDGLKEIVKKLDPPLPKELSDKVWSKFEIHAVEVFNPRHKYRKGKLDKYNLWTHYPNSIRFKMIDEILEAIAPYIEEIRVYQIEKEKILDYCIKRKITNASKKEQTLWRVMADYLYTDFNTYLKGNGTEGVIVSDRLDSHIRDLFTSRMKQLNPSNLWTDVITVESDQNAFAQIADIITYCAYRFLNGDKSIPSYKSIRKMYKRHIESKLIQKNVL